MSRHFVNLNSLPNGSLFRLACLPKEGKLIYTTTGSALVEYKIPKRITKKAWDGTITEKDIVATERVTIALNTQVIPLDKK